MMKFTKKAMSLAMGAFAVMCVSAAPKYVYDSVPGDPLHTKIYTLPNGLKVFMSQNAREPRIQANIAVRVGGKNDPAETTGLAHYFEHLMFKGTSRYGTMNYALEKPMLDEIESLFETYRQTTDSITRTRLYNRIDSISYEASKLAIPNEYDKMMAAIGANGTNAFTSADVTCYIENIPSNELERWAIIQADRFKEPVLRGFHTELETIYEEKNMSLTNDTRKNLDKMLEILFPSHPYGTQTVLGTQTHLKNPSITNIKNYHDKWYVPNNMLIALSGDFNPDDAVDIIIRYFGDMKPNNDLKMIEVKPEKPFTAPVRAELWGLDAERITLAWRLPAAAHKDMLALNVLSSVLSNGSAGLIDINLLQNQKLLGGGSLIFSLADHGAFMLVGLPRAGQSLANVEELLLDELGKVRDGKFSDKLLESVKANIMLEIEGSIVRNDSRVDQYVGAFVNGKPWSEAVTDLKRIKDITKADIVAVANKYLGSKNFAAISKLQGAPKDELKMSKPAITPIVTNRDTTSAFLRNLVSMPVKDIEPKFVDFQKELKSVNLANGTQLLYTHNPYNDIFNLTFIYETGSWADKYLLLAAEYIDLVGTKSMTPAQVQEEFYSLACEYMVSVGGSRSYIALRGLSENMGKALTLLETLVREAVSDNETFAAYVESKMKGRSDEKANQSSNFSALCRYMKYGADHIKALTVSEQEMRALSPEKVVEPLRNMLSLKHRIIYYGPMAQDKVVAVLDENHVKGIELAEPAPFKFYSPAKPEETTIFVAPYDAKQLYMSMHSSEGREFDLSIHPQLSLYNEYFGGSMNAVVFQEMREARSLAYSAWAVMAEPTRLDEPYTYIAQIATQNDKLMDAIGAFNSIINDMPQSEAAFNVAKDAIESRLRTNRILDESIAWNYINASDLELAPSLDGDGRNRSRGIDVDRQLYEALPGLTLADVVKFQQENVKGRKYYYCILGKIEDLDMDALSKLGKVVILKTEDIFGF